MKALLEQAGFNILFATQVKNLPSSLTDYFKKEEKNQFLLLIGSGGKNLWNKLPNKDSPDPIDTYATQTMKKIVEEKQLSNAKILFPFSERLLPLQALGRHFHFSHSSPIGIDISEEFGLWFAYRGVLLCETPLEIPNKHAAFNPCNTCSHQPCLQTLDLTQARLLCPYKQDQQYSPEQLEYHQKILETFEL